MPKKAVRVRKPKKTAAPKVTFVNATALTFRDRNEVLRIYNTGGALVKYLTAPSSVCAALGKEIKISPKPFATGSSGSISDVIFPGAKKGQYVIKSFSVIVDVELVNPPRPLRDAAAAMKEYDTQLLVDVNGGDPDKVVSDIKVPMFVLPCSPVDNPKYKTNVRDQEVTLTEPYYLCKTESVPEYVLSLLVAELYRDGTCAHFLDTVDFMTCVKHDEPKQYVIMEKADRPLDVVIDQMASLSSHEREKLTIGLLIQTLFAVACYQHRYQISHNDLHQDNVLVKDITPDTEWNGQALASADWHHYHILGVDLYMPAIAMLVKVADFGTGIKWSPPIIGYVSVITEMAIVPTEYTPQYDSLLILFIMHERSATPIDFIRSVLKTSIRKAKIKNITRPDGVRPHIAYVDRYRTATAVNLLTNTTLMAEYTLKPTTGRIVTLGTLT